MVEPDPLISKLIRRMGDDDPVVRRNAVGALRLHGTRAEAAIPALAQLTHDADWRVRLEAQRALKRIRKPAA